MVHLQEMHERFKDRGLVVLGFNTADTPEIARDLLREHQADFPTVLKAGPEGHKVSYGSYKVSGVPANYLIDRQGVIAAAWIGYRKGDRRALDALKTLGLE